MENLQERVDNNPTNGTFDARMRRKSNGKTRVA